MSGGYKDDVDNGNTMCVAGHCFFAHFISPCCRTYTGTGGYGDDNGYGGGSWGTRIQTEDQSFEHKDNKALFVRSHDSIANAWLTVQQMSHQLGKLVRVIRGSQLPSKYAPAHGFVMDNAIDGAANSLSLGTAMTAFIK